MTNSKEAALAYHEPSIETILIQSSFFLLLNVLNWGLDVALYCGLVGQILVGIAWGTPGGQILSPDAQYVVVQLGYLGLVLLVFEGGLSTSFPSLKANILLSAGVAITGIGCPIALSFVLAPLVGASHLQCFAAGAALCSTSLGTTFAVLRASGLNTTRLGVVLTSAAMLDDVVGLVMVQVIANLGSSQGNSLSATTIVRPVLVSVAFAVVAVIACQFVARPITLALNSWRSANIGSRLDKLLTQRQTAFVLQSALLVALVTGASYAGTSNLFTAYIAGAAISWWDSDVPHLDATSRRQQEPNSGNETATEATADAQTNLPDPSSPQHRGIDIYEYYYQPAVKWVLQPMFFASIGFSIPITRMFNGSVLWRGVIYAILMMMAKLFCGLWLVRVPGLTAWAKSWIKTYKIGQQHAMTPANNRSNPDEAVDEPGNSGTAQTKTDTIELEPRRPVVDNQALEGESSSNPQEESHDTPESNETRNSLPNPPKPLSLYPSAVLGLAMVPRGEIGFLISAVAQSNGLFGAGTSSSDSNIFIIVTWAIVLCTVIGPLSVGLTVRHIKRLEGQAKASSSHGEHGTARDVLGVWGVQQ